MEIKGTGELKKSDSRCRPVYRRGEHRQGVTEASRVPTRWKQKQLLRDRPAGTVPWLRAHRPSPSERDRPQCALPAMGALALRAHCRPTVQLGGLSSEESGQPGGLCASWRMWRRVAKRMAFEGCLLVRRAKVLGGAKHSDGVRLESAAGHFRHLPGDLPDVPIQRYGHQSEAVRALRRTGQ